MEDFDGIDPPLINPPSRMPTPVVGHVADGALRAFLGAHSGPQQKAPEIDVSLEVDFSLDVHDLGNQRRASLGPQLEKIAVEEDFIPDSA